MPPRTRKSTPDTELPDVEAPDGVEHETPAHVEEAPPGCLGCFPSGWPEGASAVGCEHGSWQREPAAD